MPMTAKAIAGPPTSRLARTLVDLLEKQRTETETRHPLDDMARPNQVAHYPRSITEVVADPLPVTSEACRVQSYRPQDARNLLLVPVHFFKVILVLLTKTPRVIVDSLRH